MAIAIDATNAGSFQAGGSTSLTLSHTIGSGSDRVLVVLLATSDSTAGFPSAVTFNGVSMTSLGGVGTTNNPLLVDAWYLLNPDVGTFNIVITKPSSPAIAVAAISFFGGEAPTSQNGNGADAQTSSSLGLTAAKSGILIDVITTLAQTPSAHGSQTSFGAHTNYSGTKDQSCSYKLISAGSPTMDWTFSSDDFVTGGVFFPAKDVFFLKGININQAVKRASIY